MLVEQLALRTDSGGAGKCRGGIGYDSITGAVDCRTIVIADRVRLGCYGLNGGKAGEPFCVTIDTRHAARSGGLVDGEPVLAGKIVRVVTTGGGGWGDPLEREPELVQRDVIEGKVSVPQRATIMASCSGPVRASEPFSIDASATSATPEAQKGAAGRTRHD